MATFRRFGLQLEKGRGAGRGCGVTGKLEAFRYRTRDLLSFVSCGSGTVHKFLRPVKFISTMKCCQGVWHDEDEGQEEGFLYIYIYLYIFINSICSYL